MNLSLDRDHLLTQLGTAARVASTRSAIQALSGVHLVARDGRAELRATDMEVGLRVPLEAELGAEGSAVVPARLLLEVVRALPQPRCTLELPAGRQEIRLTSGNATFALRTLREEDFPPLPEPAGDDAVRLPAAAFVETVATVARAASRDETRPILTGILVQAQGEELRMVATDSYRLSVRETRLAEALSGGFEANVPARALQELARIAQAAGEDAELTVAVRESQHQIVFGVGDVVLSSRLIDGQFPNYRQLLPDAYEHELRLAGDEVRDVVRRIALLAQKNAPLRLAFAEGEVTVSAQTPDVGEARETVPVPFHGEPLEIGFNPDFLRDGLDSAKGDVVLRLISPLRPGLIASPDGDDFLYLIMPIRLNV